MVQMYWEKAVARYDPPPPPPSNLDWGGLGVITPKALLKVGNYVNMKVGRGQVCPAEKHTSVVEQFTKKKYIREERGPKYSLVMSLR